MQVSFQVTAEKDFISKFSDPQFWQVYKLYVLREITEKASEVIRTHASRMWKDPTGALDQSWFTRIDAANGVGSILNSKPYSYYLNYGIRAHKMTYLLNAHNAYWMQSSLGHVQKIAVIPLKLKDGSRIFRVATSRQMMQNPGGPPWWHPGIEPKRFLEGGLQDYKDQHLQRDFKGLTIKILGI